MEKFPSGGVYRSQAFGLTNSGDISLLRVDAIVNAANSALLGCFAPEHKCIDNIIHAKAGPRLRVECRRLMKAQGHYEPTGTAKITPGYCLPSRCVIHTVGPVWDGYSNKEQLCKQLESCYLSCLNVLTMSSLRTIAFCCVSTGIFGFPKGTSHLYSNVTFLVPAARIAISTVLKWLSNPNNAASVDRVIFDVFTPDDHKIYQDVVCEQICTESNPRNNESENSLPDDTPDKTSEPKMLHVSHDKLQQVLEDISHLSIQENPKQEVNADAHKEQNSSIP